MSALDTIRRLSPCPHARAWAAGQPDLPTAWAACRRGDWMLWLLAKTVAAAPDTPAREKFVSALRDCAAITKFGVRADATSCLAPADIIGCAISSHEHKQAACADAVRTHFPDPPGV